MLRSWGSGALGLTILGFGCSFDGSGAGGAFEESGTATEDADGSTTGVSGMDDGPPTTTPPTTGDDHSGTADPQMTTDPDSTTAPAADDSSTATSEPATTSSGDESTTGIDPCANTTEETIIWVEEAILGNGVNTQMSNALPGNPLIAYGREAGTGTITFPFEVACPAEFRVYGLVWDDEAGANNGADSFYVSADGGTEIVWSYGCQTWGNPDQNWSWLDVRAWNSPPCNVQGISYTLEAGAHEITLRNRENAGWGDDIAAVAAIIVTSDPNTDPDAIYDPHG